MLDSYQIELLKLRGNIHYHYYDDVSCSKSVNDINDIAMMTRARKKRGDELPDLRSNDVIKFDKPC